MWPFWGVIGLSCVYDRRPPTAPKALNDAMEYTFSITDVLSRKVVIGRWPYAHGHILRHADILQSDRDERTASHPTGSMLRDEPSGWDGTRRLSGWGGLELRFKDELILTWSIVRIGLCDLSKR